MSYVSDWVSLVERNVVVPIGKWNLLEVADLLRDDINLSDCKPSEDQFTTIQSMQQSCLKEISYRSAHKTQGEGPLPESAMRRPPLLLNMAGLTVYFI